MPRPAPSESQREIHRFEGVPQIWRLDNIRAELGHPQPSYLHGVDARVLPDHVQLCARHPRRCAQIVEGMSSTLMTHLRMILEHGHRTAAKPKGADRADARGGAAAAAAARRAGPCELELEPELEDCSVCEGSNTSRPSSYATSPHSKREG